MGWYPGLEYSSGGIGLCTKNKLGEKGGGIDLDVRRQLECMLLCLGMDDEPAESLWVRFKVQACMDGTVVGLKTTCQPDQEEKVDEAFYKQQEIASC